MSELSILQHLPPRTLREIGAFRYQIWTGEGAAFYAEDTVRQQSWTDRLDTAATTTHLILRKKAASWPRRGSACMTTCAMCRSPASSAVSTGRATAWWHL